MYCVETLGIGLQCHSNDAQFLTRVCACACVFGLQGYDPLGQTALLGFPVPSVHNLKKCCLIPNMCGTCVGMAMSLTVLQ